MTASTCRPHRGKPTTRPAAFTIVELMVVMALLSTVVGIGVGLTMTWHQRSADDAALSQLRAAWSAMRAQAVRTGEPVVALLVKQEGAWWLAERAIPNGGGEHEAPAPADAVRVVGLGRLAYVDPASETPAFGAADAIPGRAVPTLDFGLPIAPDLADDLVVAILLPDGSAWIPGEPPRLRAGGRVHTLRVEPLSGRLSFDQPADDADTAAFEPHPPTGAGP